MPFHYIRQMTKTEIGEVLKQRRERRKLTYRQMAKTLGLNPESTQVIRYMEKGSNSYAIDNLIAACEALGLEVVVRPIRPPKK